MKSLLDPTRRRALAPAHHHGLLFITLRKSEALSSQTTRTRDLALGFADYVSYEGERPIPGASIRSWRWRFEGAAPLSTSPVLGIPEDFHGSRH